MRILAVTNLFPSPVRPHRGAFNRQQFCALAARHEVWVIAPVSWTEELAARRQGVRLSPERSSNCDGIDVRHPRYLFTPKVLRGWYGHFFERSIRRTFARAVEEFRPDVVLAAWAFPDGFAAVRLARRFGLPVVVKVHGSDVLTLLEDPQRRRRTAQALSFADGVIAVSRDLADRVAGLGAERGRVHVVYDGIDPSRFSPADKSEARQRLAMTATDPVVLFVGNLVPVKGVDILIDAAADLSRRGRPARVYIVGEGPLRGDLSRQVARLGLQDRVTFVGSVDNGKLPDWYRAADLFVLPSHSEGVPCVLLEAAACRTPYVASQVGGIPEISHLNRGRMVNPGDAGALADAMAAVLDESGAARNMEPFRRGHDDAAREIEAILEGVVKPAAGRGESPSPRRLAGVLQS